MPCEGDRHPAEADRTGETRARLAAIWDEHGLDPQLDMTRSST
jgi:hypothetical protein